MKILVINPGSSTIKFELFSNDKSLGEIVLDRHDVGDSIFKNPILFIKDKVGKDIDAIGVRVVHGGTKFTKETLVNSKVLKDIEKLSSLAPLHNPRSVEIINECFREYKKIPVVAVFDTSFHSGMPDHAKKYAVNKKLLEQYGIQKYGFHGTSHKYMYEKALEILRIKGAKAKSMKVISCHLGSGSSVCAIRGGKSLDTSMGMTPLDGLPMMTRCGDIDPEVIFHLLAKRFNPDSIKHILEKESGLLGLYGKSGDMRDIVKNMTKDKNARLAFDVFTYKVACYISTYLAPLSGLDVLIFGAGIGEHHPKVRKRVCEYLEFLGVKLDSNLNLKNKEGVISKKNSKVKVMIIRTDEEKEIARLTYKLLK